MPVAEAAPAARRLAVPAGFALPAINPMVAAGDTMFDGRSEHYLAVGLSALACIETALDGRIPNRILDLPCGWGRVTRVLRARYPGARITVADLDRDGVDFAAASFDATPLYAPEETARLRLPDSYDLIWVGSLATHLSEAASAALLQVLAASLAPDGTLVATSHGPSIVAGLTGWGYGLPPGAAADVLDAYVAAGYGHRGYGGDDGYGISLADRDWWARAAASCGLVLARYDGQAWDDHQDVVVLRRDRHAPPSQAADAASGRAARSVAARYDPVMRAFDAAYYLRVNPDVAAGLAAGDIPSAYAHYLAHGRREGRQPNAAPPAAEPLPVAAASPDRFDEAWYLATYADVSEAVAAGRVASGLEHFCGWGRAEGRLPYAGAEPVLSDEERRARVGAAWSDDPAASPGVYWMGHPMVRDRVNARASGDRSMDGYGRLKQLLAARGVTLPLGRAVSLGCGFGALERALAADGIIREIDAYDIAPAAIAEARRLAEAAGLDGLRYHVADLETMAFPPREVDVVFAHSSVHHVERLEPLFAAVAAMLKPGGIFHLNEFVGPTRFQWTDAQMAAVNRFLEALPPRLRRMPSGAPRPLQTRPTVAAMIAADPSEAIRSSDIIPVIGRYFDVLETRELGGALLHLGLDGITQNFDPESPEDCRILAAFFAAEDRAMQEGAVGSDFAIITAVNRPRTAA